MKTNSLKNKLAIILSALMVLSVAFGVIGFNSAKANGTALNEIVTEFTMGGGQSVRLAKEEGDPKGMRFIAKLSADNYDAINGAEYDSVEYGYFIMPSYYETKIGAINEENTFGANAKYTWEGKVGAGTYAVIHNVGAEPVLDEDSGDYLIKGSVVGMQPQNLATKYTGKMYIKATKGDVSEYVFADALVSKYSMIDVAIMAMDTGVEDDSLQDYIDDYKAWYLEQKGVEPTYSYTINYVAGDEIVDTQVVENIDINTQINLTATAPAGYVLDANKSSQNVLSGKVYADNNLTLTVYVKADVALVGKLYNGEFYHFEKRAEEDALVEFDNAIGSVDSVKIGETVLDAETFAYDDSTKTLTINQAVVASLATGDVKMTISNANAIYTADVTVADVIVNTESELYSAFEYISGEVASHCTDYIILGNDITCETVYTRNVTAYRMGIFDGKGHVISNLNVTKPFTASLQSVSTFKNVVFLNATNASTSGFLGADSGTYEFDNVAIIFKENRGGGLVNYSAGNMTFKNSIMIDLKSSASTEVGYISRTYNSARATNFTNSCVVTDKAPFQGGTDTTTAVYQSALAMRVATNAEDWFKSLNGVIPSCLNSDWLFDANGNLCYKNYVVMKNTVDLVGEKNNGELFYFSKNVTVPTGYASEYVANGNYNVTLPTDVGTINSVTIAGTEITGFAYADKVLSIPVSAVASLANGTTAMEIDASTATYKATVTIATSVMYNGADVRAVLNTEETLGASGAGNDAYIVLDGDIAWDWTIFPSGWGKHLYGTIDGKGYAITDMRVTAYLFHTIQGGSVIKNIAFLNVSYGADSSFLCIENAVFTVENVAITYSAGVCVGLVNNIVNDLIIRNTIVVCNSTSYGYAGTYNSARTLVLENSYCVTSTAAIKTPTSTEDTLYVNAQATVCADYTALKTASNNFANFDSNYWSVDASGNLCFGGNIVINA